MSNTGAPISVRGLHHLKLPVSSLKTTHTFYTTILSLTSVPKLNHYMPDGSLFAVMLVHGASNLTVELRYDPASAVKQKGWDPITWAVGTRRDLEDWKKWFEKNEIPCSAILKGVKSWVLAAEDPDGKIIKLFVDDEEHEWATDVDVDERWLGRTSGDPNATGL